LTGNVLIVEDEAIIALDLQGILTFAGYRVIGPVTSVTEALPVLVSQKLDAAILDIHLGKQMVYPVADKLLNARVPFVFVTGQPLQTIPQNHRNRLIVRKPYHPQKILETLTNAIYEVAI
jgi:two-component SAPR family response regulator